MRASSTVIAVCCLVFAAQAEAPRRALQGSTEQAADAPGWNGRLPEGVDPRALTGAGSRIGLEADYGGGYGYSSGYQGSGYGFDAGPCGWNAGPALPGGSRSAGSISGGTFRSTVRCADGNPGLALRHRPAVSRPRGLRLSALKSAVVIGRRFASIQTRPPALES